MRENESTQDYSARLGNMRDGRVMTAEQWAKVAAPMVTFLSVRWDLESDETKRETLDKLVAEMPLDLTLYTADAVAQFVAQFGE